MRLAAAMLRLLFLGEMGKSYNVPVQTGERSETSDEVSFSL